MINHKKDEIIFTRRSIRHFTSQKIESEKVDLLLRAAMQAPSARNQQSWEFIVLQDEARIHDFAQRLTSGNPLLRASLGIVLLANETKMATPAAWQHDMGACTENILLEAAALDLGGVWIGVDNSPELTSTVHEFFHLPSHIKPFSIVALGYPEQEENQFVDRYLPERVHYETWE